MRMPASCGLFAFVHPQCDVLFGAGSDDEGDERSSVHERCGGRGVTAHLALCSVGEGATTTAAKGGATSSITTEDGRRSCRSPAMSSPWEQMEVCARIRRPAQDLGRLLSRLWPWHARRRARLPSACIRLPAPVVP